MRIVYVASHIEPVHTGGERYNLHLIRAAERAGIEVVCLPLSANPVYRWLNDTPLLWRLCRFAGWLWAHIQMLRQRRELLLFDVWMAPMLWPGGAWLSPRYLVMVHHLVGGLHGGLRGRWLGFCERHLLRGAARILTVSQSSRRQVEAHTEGTVPVDVVNTAFEPVQGITRGGGEVVRLLFVGHVTRAKGVVELARAAASLPRERPWHLDIVGRDSVEPETTQKVRDICRTSGIEDRVTLHGRLDDADLLSLYLSADIFVLPSHWEGYGIVLLEAMSHRLAVVSTTAGAIPEVVVDGESGLLVAPGDEQALAQVIARLVEDAELRDRLAQSGLAFARRHPDWAAMELQCMDWWQAVAARREC